MACSSTGFARGRRDAKAREPKARDAKVREARSFHWKTSLNVGALVTLVAAVHYFYMREFWVTLHGSPVLYRYIDWLITVPLQMIEFYLILSAVKPEMGYGIFTKLLGGTVIMLVASYMGEKIFAGEASFVPDFCWRGMFLGAKSTPK